jgi:DNA-binding response OmpR family regulator
VDAAKVNHPFSIKTKYGILNGKAGDYLLKPWDPNEVHTSIHSQLPKEEPALDLKSNRHRFSVATDRFVDCRRENFQKDISTVDRPQSNSWSHSRYKSFTRNTQHIFQHDQNVHNYRHCMKHSPSHLFIYVLSKCQNKVTIS